MAAHSAADAALDAATREPMGMHPRLEQFRVELIGYCYRMLGSASEAEDAVQETLMRAWRRPDRFDEDRAPLRSWLYAIATNVCLDLLRSAQRRARAMDLGPASSAGASLGVPLPERAWVQPIPDRRVLPAGGDPAELAVQRETIRLAFVPSTACGSRLRLARPTTRTAWCPGTTFANGGGRRSDSLVAHVCVLNR